MRGKTYQEGREKSRSPDRRRRADALRDDERRRQASYVSSLGIKHKVRVVDSRYTSSRVFSRKDGD